MVANHTTQATRWHCARCQVAARSRTGRARMERQECKGIVVAPLVSAVPDSPGTWARPLGHLLLRTGNVFWCDICGRYADKRCGKLLEICPCNDDKGKSSLSRLRRGLHPTKDFKLTGEACKVTTKAWREWAATH